MPRESKYTEKSIEDALCAIKNGMTQMQASRIWGILRGTFQGRIRCGQPMREAKESAQRLSKQQEKHLCDWFLHQAAIGLPPTHQQLKEFAGRIVRAGGDLQPLGKNWISGFLARNPEIQTIRDRSVDSDRIKGASVTVIKEWFRLMNLPVIKAIPPQFRHDMDETDMLEGLGSNGIVLGGAEKRKTEETARNALLDHDR